MFKLTKGQVEAEILAEKIIKQTIKITDEELHEAYEEELGEKILARQIVFRTLKDAEETLERIRTGADFEALAKRSLLIGILLHVEAKCVRLGHKELWEKQ